jgi:hypothetical protein
VVVLAVWGGVHLATRPPVFEDALQRFESAWNDGATDRLTEFFGEELRSKIDSYLSRRNTRLGRKGLPVIDRSLVSMSTDTRRRVDSSLNDGFLQCVWSLEDGEWLIMSVKYD